MTETTKLATNIGTFKALLQKNEAKIAAVLPQHLTPERLMSIAATVVQANPGIAECTPTSVLGCVIQSAQVGLSLDPSLGQAHLVPFNSKVKDPRTSVTYKEKRAQFIIGYRGLIHLARNSGDVGDIFAMPVYEGEEFNEEITQAGPTFVHVPMPGPFARDQLRCVYMVAKYKAGGSHYGRMWNYEIDLVRDRSRAKDNGPWVTDYIEMAKKTVVRREAKYLPLSVDVQSAISNDERADLGIDPATVIDLDDGETVPVGPLPEAPHNDPNTMAQNDLDDLKDNLDGKVAVVGVQRGCKECGVQCIVPGDRDTFECQGCSAINVLGKESK